MISLLGENQWLNPNLSKREIDNFKKSEFTFSRMLNELAILHECIENNTLHLAEFKLSVGTRKTLRKIYKHSQQISDISLLVEAATDPISAADTSKNILSLINKFHTDNKQYLDNVGSDERLKDTSIPKNIGAEPSIIQKAALKTKELGGKAGQIAMNLFQSIVVNALTRFVNWSSSLKSDILDAKKQGSAWQMIMSKLGPSMKIAKRAPDGTITYENDSSGKSTLDQLQNFTKLNPKWTNTIIGLLINITKMLSVSFAGATVGTSLAIGVFVGLLIRTVAGHYLKKETWGEAFKKSLVVTGLSLVGGSLTKGLFSYFKGGGFIDGAKSYFTGDAAPDISDKNDASSRETADNFYDSVGERKMNQAINAVKGKANFGNVITHRDTDWSKRLEDATGQDDPDEYLKVLGNAAAQGDEASKRELLGLLKQAGPMPKADFDELSNAYGLDDNQKMAFIKLFKVKSDVAADAAGAATGAAQSLKELGKLALGGDAKAANEYMQQFLVSGKGGETQYRILKTAFDAKIIDKEKFFSGVGTQTLNLSAQLRGNVPVSINGVSVIDYLTPKEASNAYAAMSMAQSMGNPVNADELAKLAAKAGKAVTNAVNMSPEDDLRLEGNQVTNVAGTASKAVKESLYKTLIKKLYI